MDASVVLEVRKAARQFAMLYFHFCKTLFDELGEEEAVTMVQRSIFHLAVDRSEGLRTIALERGLDPTVELFKEINDLPYIGWNGWKPSMGGVKCPYAEVWIEYIGKHEWFQRFASLYCNVVDTTTMEHFTQNTSHKITKNLLWGDECCSCEYFPSEDIRNNRYTYGVLER